VRTKNNTFVMPTVVKEEKRVRRWLYGTASLRVRLVGDSIAVWKLSGIITKPTLRQILLDGSRWPHFERLHAQLADYLDAVLAMTLDDYLALGLAGAPPGTRMAAPMGFIVHKRQLNFFRSYTTQMLGIGVGRQVFTETSPAERWARDVARLRADAASAPESHSSARMPPLGPELEADRA
jgi:hypothetical protein